MEINWENVGIYIKPGATDMRKQINTLSVYVENQMNMSPLNGNLYVFCGKNRRRIKILYWDINGFCLWQKRLEKDKFPWPKDEEEAHQIRVEELRMLLHGIDFFNKHKELRYSSVS
jgi:transposase